MIGKRIRTLRTARGWTQSELARRSGIAQGYISQLEGGKRTGESIGADVLQKLAGALDTTIDALVNEPPPPDLSRPPVDLLQAARLRPDLVADLVDAWPRYSVERRLDIIARAERLKKAHEETEGPLLLETLATLF